MKTLQQEGGHSLVRSSVATEPVSHFVSQLLQLRVPRRGSAQLKPVLVGSGSLVTPVPRLLGPSPFPQDSPFHSQ